MAKQKAEIDNAEQPEYLIHMYTETPDHPGGPDQALVHPDEVENWKALGWRVKE